MSEFKDCLARWYDGKNVNDTLDTDTIEELKAQITKLWLRPSHDQMVEHGVISPVAENASFETLAKTVCDDHPAGMEIIIWEHCIHAESY